MTRRIAILLCAASALPGQVRISQHPDRISVEIGGKPFTEFFIGPDTRKPYLHPLRSASGKIVTRQFPMKPDVPGESRDHPHHQGLSFTHAEVNGFNVWASDSTQQDAKSGSIRLNKVVKAAGGAKTGEIRALFDWRDHDGKTMLTEDRTTIFHSDPANRVIDLDIDLAAQTRVTFGDTKEGTFNIRLATPLEEAHGGLMVGANGCRAEKECWGSRAEWMDYSGRLEGEDLGVAIFDHPANPHHPTYWHSRSYGLFAANPFGAHDFLNDKKADGSITLEPGQHLRFRYRVLIHPGRTDPAALRKAYTEYTGGADTILRHGKIVTNDKKFSIAQAVAIEGGRIAAVGSDESVLAAFRGPRTEVVDLEGRTVLPGLVDSHVHALWAGLSEYPRPLPPLRSYEDVRNYIRAEAKRAPAGKWIVVPRTFPTRLAEMRMPTRELLDVEQEHPVLFDASYVLILNTAGLKRLGIDRNTPAPPGGEIVKDANGEPNGIIRNAEPLLKGEVSVNPVFSRPQQLDALEKMLRRYLAIGLTTVGDRAVTAEEVALYRELKASGKLPIRTVLTWRLNAAPPVEQLTKAIRESGWTTGQGDEWLKFGSFKVTLDGGMTIGTAWQREPYGPFAEQLYGLTDRANRGQLFIAPDKLLQIMRAARDKGWQMTAHSQGGGAVDVLLDTFEKLNAEQPIAPSRSHWMHASFQTPEAIARAAKIGMLADVQPAWLHFDGPALEKVFGHDGMKWFFPLRAYLDAGIMIAGGSDHMIGFDPNNAVNAYNPFLSMWIAVTRKTVAGTVLNPEQRITREEALRMYTSGPAYLQFAEHDRGSIEVSKLADMVVIDRDYLTCPEDEIRAIRPLQTILNGKVAWKASR